MPRVLLCDLDGTLVDRDAGFALWADEFASRWGLNEEQREWLAAEDAAQKQRGPFFAAVAAHLALPEDPDALWDQYRSRIPHLAPAIAGVVEGLTKLRTQGWLLAVVTNGKADNQRGKLAASGLDRLFHAVAISDEIGVRKPDRRIFIRAVEACSPAGEVDRLWMIGDDPVLDVKGGHDAAAATIWISGDVPWEGTEYAPTVTVRNTAEGLAHLLADER